MAPLWMWFNCLKARATLSHSLYQPRKDERLIQPWSHPVVLNTGPLDGESSTLTTRPLHLNHWATRYYKRSFANQQNAITNFKPLECIELLFVL